MGSLSLALSCPRSRRCPLAWPRPSVGSGSWGTACWYPVTDRTSHGSPAGPFGRVPDQLAAYGTGDQVREQLRPWDRAADIVTILLPPGMPWHNIEATLQAAAPSARPGRAQRDISTTAVGQATPTGDGLEQRYRRRQVRRPASAAIADVMRGGRGRRARPAPPERCRAR